MTKVYFIILIMCMHTLCNAQTNLPHFAPIENCNIEGLEGHFELNFKYASLGKSRLSAAEKVSIIRLLKGKQSDLSTSISLIDKSNLRHYLQLYMSDINFLSDYEDGQIIKCKGKVVCLKMDNGKIEKVYLITSVQKATEL